MDVIEKEGPSVAEAVASAARALGIDPKDAQVLVLSPEGARRAKVRVGRPGVALPTAPAAAPAASAPAPAPVFEPRPQRPEAVAAPSGPVRTPPTEAQAERAAQDLERLLRAMGVEGSVERKNRSGNVVLNVVAPQHEQVLIGRRGATAEALQVLVNAFMERREGDPSLLVHVDVADYHARQEARLVEKAQALAEQVLRDGGQASMGPLSAAERRSVHLALKLIDGVETFSVGQGSTKKLVVARKG